MVWCKHTYEGVGRHVVLFYVRPKKKRSEKDDTEASSNNTIFVYV